MAGTPIKTAMIEAIELAGGEAALIDRIADGETMADLARALGCSRNLLSTYMNRDETRRATVQRARETGADAMAEDTIRIADGALASQASAARLRIEQRRWFASKVLPDTYGEKNQTSITVNVNTLHLEALRQLRTERIIDIGHATVQSNPDTLQLTDNAMV